MPLLDVSIFAKKRVEELHKTATSPRMGTVYTTQTTQLKCSSIHEYHLTPGGIS